MLAKSAFILLFAGACLAYPADEKEALTGGPMNEPLPPLPLPPQPLPPQPLPLQPIAVSPEDPQGPVPLGPMPLGEVPQGQIPPGAEGGKPENADLKTDNSFWFRRSYYPTFYQRSYYYPRSYYPTFYKSWSWPSYWW